MSPRKASSRPRPPLRISKKAVWINVGLVVMIVSVLLAYAMFADGAEIFFGALESLRWKWIWVALALMGIYLGCELMSLHVACRIAGQRIRLSSLLSVSMIGQFYGVITPMATGAQPAQLYYLTRLGASVGKSAFTLLAKFIAFQVVLTLLAGGLLASRWSFFSAHYGSLTWVALPAFAVHVAVVLALLIIALSTTVARRIANFGIRIYTRLRKSADAKSLYAGASAQIRKFGNASAQLSGNRWGMLAINLVTVVQMVSFYLIPGAVLKAFGGTLPDVITLLAAAAVVTMLQTAMPLPAGAGAAEGGFAAFFALFLPNGATVVAALLTWRAITLLVPIVVGLPFLFLVELQVAQAQFNARVDSFDYSD